MIVVILLGIVAALGIPALGSSMQISRLSAGADEVVSALIYARHFSINNSRKSRVTIDSGTNTILVEELTYAIDLSPGQIPEATVEVEAYQTAKHALLASQTYLVDLDNISRTQGVSISSASFGPGNQVIFNDDGKPSQAGTIVVVAGPYQTTIALDAPSGIITRTTP